MTYQPYQEAEEELIRRGNAPLKALRHAASIGGALAGGSSILNRILPLLSDHIPQSIAKKGLAKIDPHLGKFIESATNLGHDFYEVRDFIRGKAAEEQERKSQAKKGSENRNIVQQYSPELHQYITEEMQKGRSPLEAGAMASMQESFKKIIKQITTEHKAPFASILETVYGSSMQPNKPGSELSRESLMQQFNQGQQAQQGQGKAALLRTMQEMTKAVRQMRGQGG